VVVIKDWSMHNDELTEYTISRSNIVINLIGSYMETRNFSFEDIHHKWPAKLAKICAKSPLMERFVHISDMGANADSASRRMRSKAAGDEAVREALPGATIFR
jgi:NADH dehydrogenase (ubiquinone) 1 alpha subcomplex subunit 9